MLVKGEDNLPQKMARIQTAMCHLESYHSTMEDLLFHWKTVEGFGHGKEGPTELQWELSLECAIICERQLIEFEKLILENLGIEEN